MTISLFQLWLPILLGALLAWIASGLIHMVIKYHNSDYTKLPNEEEVMAAVGKASLPPAMYVFPHCADPSDMQNEEVQKKFASGPVGFLAIFPNGMPQMGKLMAQQVSFFVLGCALIAYCATLALPAGADYLAVFRFVASVGFVTFGWGVIPFAIWYGHPWSTTAKYLLDALIYCLLVAGTFAWLWPAAA